MFECFVHEIMSVSYNLSKHMATKGFSKWGWRKNLGVVHNFFIISESNGFFNKQLSGVTAMIY